MKVVLALFVVAFAVAALALPSKIGKRLIQFTEEGPAQWLTPAEVDEAAALHLNFIDITDNQIVDKSRVLNTRAIPTTIRFQSTVQAAISRLSVSRIEEFMVPFTTYHTRYYTTQTGVDASNYLYNQIQNAIATSGYQGRATVEQVTHSWAQKSIIARIHGIEDSNAVVILGAHLDSVTNGAVGRSPGADDNASGSTTILEAFRSLLDSGFIPKTTVEFQWYAAEEVGLRGSQAIAADYTSQGKEVVGMANFDMTGYAPASEKRIAVITDYTDATVNAFIRLLVTAYNTVAWVNDTCGYACSDHASWYRAGFKASFPHEASSSPYIHTSSDTLSNMNYARVLEYARLAAGFAIELGEPGV
jgi:leucyl aminopeptidase